MNSRRALPKSWLSFLLVVVLMAQFFLTSSFRVLGQQSSLKVGDWAEYIIKTFVQTNVTEEKIIDIYGSGIIDIIDYYKSMNNTRLKLVVEEKGPDGDIRFSIMRYLSNGTTLKEIHEGNLKTGSGNLTMWIISPNLEVGNPIYVHNITEQPTIGNIEERSFAGAKREVAFSYFPLPAIGEINTQCGVFWDRETGILCSMIMDTDCSLEDIELRFRMVTKIEKTNLWSPSEESFPLYLSITVIIIALLSISSALFLVKKGAKKKRKRKR